MKRLLSVTLALSLSVLCAKAQENTTPAKSTSSMSVDLNPKVPIRKPYWGNSLDGMIFSTALINSSGDKSLGTLRFSMFLHLGGTYNYNFNKNLGIYTGLDLKNIGFIEKFKVDHATLKNRVYALGIPVGLRVGNMNTRDYFFFGGGLDLAINYKAKYWDDNTKKQKFNEWFSDRTQLLMPYVFAGVAFKGTTIKIQYYPSNFYNKDYVVGGVTPYKPYANEKVNLLLVSLGRDIKFGKKKSK